MKKILFALFLLNYSLFSFAQAFSLSGLVIDAVTSETIPFSYLQVPSQQTGTVSNEHGEFELHLSSSKDQIVVSCVGYHRLGVPIADLLANPKKVVIRLEPANNGLQEVTITPQSGPSAADIVRQAIDRISTNYVTEPMLMDGFYREYFEENESFVAFAEASVSIYDSAAYTPLTSKAALQQGKANEQISINQLRVSDIRNQGEYVLYIDLNYALRTNLVRNINFWQTYTDDIHAKLVSLNIDKLTYLDHDMVYIISYHLEGKRAGKYTGRLFIRANDYAVLRAEVNADNTDTNRELNGVPTKSQAIITYQQQANGKWCLNYLNASHETNYVVENKKYSLKFHSELIIQHTENGELGSPTTDNTLRGSIFYQPRYRTYDPDYWTDFELFAKSPKNRGIIADLEKPRSLEQQYRANGKLKTTARAAAAVNDTK